MGPFNQPTNTKETVMKNINIYFVAGLGVICLGLIAMFAPEHFQLGSAMILFAFGMVGNVILESNSTGRKPDYSTSLTFLRPDIFTLDTIMRRMDARRGIKRATAQKVEWDEIGKLEYRDTKNGASVPRGLLVRQKILL